MPEVPGDDGLESRKGAKVTAKKKPAAKRTSKKPKQRKGRRRPVLRSPIKGEGSTQKAKPKGGRPKAKVDGPKVRTMASYGCTVDEIAAVFECSHDTLTRRFATELKEGRNARNGMLRVKQFELAKKSAAMAIFLGKNYLGQTDVVKYSGMSDAEVIARAREEGIDPGAIGEAAPAAGEGETEPTN